MQQAIHFISIILLLFLTGCTNLTNEIELVYIDGGNFIMGSDSDYAEADEMPAHTKQVQSFYLGKYEVSQKIWTKVMKLNPSYFQDDDNPVESVSHNDIQIFLERLNARTGKKYRLPTEAEWEYAAKGGRFQDIVQDNNLTNLNQISWQRENSEEKSHKIGTKVPNILGLYDMIGNVHEWCDDIYSGTNYQGDTVKLTDNGINFVFRGGCFISDKAHCRITNRNYASYTTRNFTLGFRLAHEVE